MEPSRSKITAGELVVVLSHYDLGVINTVERFRGGSRSSPKVIISTAGGEYLLKRRAPGPGADPVRVAFTHEVMQHLARGGVPVPGLIGTRADNNSLLQVTLPARDGEEAAPGCIYEVMRFIRGERYDRRPESAWAAGWWLARCHALLAGMKPMFPAPTRTYHSHARVPERLASIPGTLGDPALRGVCRALADAYLGAAERAAAHHAAGEEQIIHGDWHPGNMLFVQGAVGGHGERGHGAHIGQAHMPAPAQRVAAIFDFDAARLGLTLHDLANGAMQFAVQRHVGADAPEAGWRIALDPDLLGAFFAGYREGAQAASQTGVLSGWWGRGKPDQAGSAKPAAVTQDGLQAVPWLMIEALIVEAALPIASTGRFGKLAAGPVLGVVLRAVQAIAEQADRVSGLAGRP